MSDRQKDRDAVEIDGDLETKESAVTYKLGGRTLAVAMISRDLQNLQVEADMEPSFQTLADLPPAGMAKLSSARLRA